MKHNRSILLLDSNQQVWKYDKLFFPLCVWLGGGVKICIISSVEKPSQIFRQPPMAHPLFNITAPKLHFQSPVRRERCKMLAPSVHDCTSIQHDKQASSITTYRLPRAWRKFCMFPISNAKSKSPKPIIAIVNRTSHAK